MWSRRSISACLGAAALCGCASVPQEPAPPQPPATAAERASQSATTRAYEEPQARTASEAGAGDGAAAPAGRPAGSAAPAGAATGPASTPPPELPPRAVADFERALALLRGGNATEAQLELQQLSLAYPSLAGPHVNLGILHRKAGRLEESEQALRAAVERNGASAVAWTELGVTLRQQGKFAEARAAYESALAADPAYAPAHRNLGVLLDLYLGEPERALAAFERYRELTGEDRPVSGWIAELRQRTGRPATAPRASPPAAEPAGEAGASSGAGPPAQPPSGGAME